MRQPAEVRRPVVAGLVGIVLATGACAGPPPQLKVESLANTACQSVPVGTSNYYSAWVVKGPANGAERIRSIRLVNGGTSPAIRVLGYYVQARGGVAAFGGSWTAGEVGGVDRHTYVQETGLRPPGGVTIHEGATVDLAVAVKVDGLGVSRWKGMDVTYISGSHTVTQRIDPAMTIYGVPSLKVDDCPR